MSTAGTSFQFFSRGGGNILTDFLGGGGYEKNKNCVQKHKKPLFFKFRGGGKCPPQMTPLEQKTINWSLVNILNTSVGCIFLSVLFVKVS